MTTQAYRPPHVRRRVEERGARLRELGYSRYGEYLQSAHWQQLRATYRASELPQVCVCGDEDVHLHHMTYDRVGAERLDDLTPLCRRCHALVHVLEWRGEIGLDLDGLYNEERAQAGRAWLVAELEARRCEAAEREADEKAHVLSLSFAARVLRARRVMKARHMQTTALGVLKGCVRRGASDKELTRRLRIFEAQVYGWDDWPL